MVAERNPEIRKAVNTLYELSADEKLQAEYEMRQKAWRDRLSQNEGYYMDGIQKGRLEGRKEALFETARKMKSRGRSIQEIVEDTGLSLVEVESLY